MTLTRTQERRAGHGEAFAHVLLDARQPVCFADFVAAAPSATTRELADWLGHAIGDGIVVERDAGSGGDRCFALSARGRRILSAARRRGES